MTTTEIISILRSNCARLTQIVDKREMQKIYEATDDVITILQNRSEAEGKQKPMKVIHKMTKAHDLGKYGYVSAEDINYCPSCGEEIEDVPHHYYQEYCSYCGQALDWGDD